MLESLQRKIKIRAFIALTLIHLGLASAVYALTTLPPYSLPETTQRLLWVGVLGLYGGMLTGVFFVVRPLLPWIRRARKIRRWREFALSELPLLLALLPVIIETIRALMRAWQRPASPYTEGHAQAQTSAQAQDDASAPPTGAAPKHAEPASSFTAANATSESMQIILRAVESAREVMARNGGSPQGGPKNPK